jgi:hypothetical protein
LPYELSGTSESLSCIACTVSGHLPCYKDQHFFVANPLNRYRLSQRNKLKHNADGSVDLYIQHENPGGAKESNWLPAPTGRFVLMLRLYWPKATPPSIIDGTWNPPAVEPVVSN